MVEKAKVVEFIRFFNPKTHKLIFKKNQKNDIKKGVFNYGKEIFLCRQPS